MSVNEVVREAGLNRSRISRHLSILGNAAAVKCHRHANEVVYQLANESIGELCDIVQRALSVELRDTIKLPVEKLLTGSFLSGYYYLVNCQEDNIAHFKPIKDSMRDLSFEHQ